MSDQYSPRTDTPTFFAAGSETFAGSRVVGMVFDTLLTAVHEGRLQPGERINDGVIAEQLGVSRTPVREALQRLREIGIVEASASRFTRIAMITPQQTADAMTVWLSLYDAVVTETIPLATADIVDAMRVDNARFLACLVAPDAHTIAEANADFYGHLAHASRNPALQRAINSVVHQVRLGSQHLPEFIDVRAIAVAQELLIAATRDHDVAAARQSLRMLSLIDVTFSNHGFVDGATESDFGSDADVNAGPEAQHGQRAIRGEDDATH